MSEQFAVPKLATIWAAVESNPLDKLSLLAYADALDEEQLHPHMARACRWMAHRCHAPFKDSGRKREPWRWLREYARGTGGSRSSQTKRKQHPQAIIPAGIWDQLPDRWGGKSGVASFATVADAVEALAVAIKKQRDQTEVMQPVE